MFLLVPSPLLGPATWRPVEDWLRAQGHEASTVDLGSARRTPEGVVEAVRAAAGSRPVVLVPHSNAGLYAAHLGTVLSVTATVYVDAALPGPTATETPLAPEAFLGFLRDLADPDGTLPPWTQWWPDVDHLFPDAATRTAVEREQARVPLGYFKRTVPVPERWTERPAGYLAFGDTYAAEYDLARTSGWPVQRLDGAHLHQLIDPGAVGAAVAALAEAASS
ncbi:MULTISPECIES: hypothetical protein [unclassified Aeromicrobium]|uniref:hypothetical protein n=1 Tax=unclassified Aeromicrobium TaxID=2633570 RepID=UPI00396B06C3